MKKKSSNPLSLKEFEQRVRSLFISRNSIADTFEGILIGFESKVAQDQLSILDIIVEKCSSNPERLQEFREAGGYQKFFYFFSQSKDDETEENPDFYLLGFQLLKILVFLDKSGFNGEAFKCFVDVFWKSTNLEIVLGALLYIKQLAETGHETIENLLKSTQAEIKVAIKWMSIIHKNVLMEQKASEYASFIEDAKAIEIRDLTEVEKHKFTEHVINFYRSKFEEGFMYLPPFSLVSKFTVELAKLALDEEDADGILSLHIRFHLGLLKFITKDPLGYSKSILNESSLGAYFMNLFQVFSIICQTDHDSDSTDIIAASKETLDTILLMIFIIDEHQKASVVDFKATRFTRRL